MNLLTAGFGLAEGRASAEESTSEVAASATAPSSEGDAAMLLRLHEEERARRELEGEITRITKLTAV